ncbi:G-patch domain-containing protein [Besnoitia besnoiti]|uniref:G-patch domain-containing protein n=1 Tax=Besnoitia besnoiti TaxID=94643 RepID=A0A2A9MMN6_BESBE|nr:G-patch domain-containing protein [Besnoitia besnoiti]PFH37073.1 G-patch domain-containing protein [Besnoitia besnoiti]
MLDSLYGDLPPPSKDDGGPPKTASLLGSLYDDLDDPPATSSSSSSSSSSSAPSSSWAAQRLQLLTPAVVRKQTLAKSTGGGASQASATQTSSGKPLLDVAAVAAAASAAAAAVAAQLKAVKSEAFAGDKARGALLLRGGGDKEREGADKAGLGAASEDQPASALAFFAGVKKEEETKKGMFALGGDLAGRDGSEGAFVGKEQEDGGSAEIGKMKDEYDPGNPNDYSAVYRERIRKQQREELERLRQQELEKQRRERENGPAGAGSSLSGVAFGDSPSTPSAPVAPPAPPALPSYIDPAKKSFAARMMEKMGWKHGEGLGVNKQGITAPLVAKKTAMRSGVIVQGAEVVAAAAQARAQFNRPPTRVLLLLNMVGRGEVDEDLKDETEEEAAKFGNLLQVKIVEAPEAPDEEAVRIFCEYERKEEATRAFMTMNGRVFGGRTVKGKFYCEERWEKNDLLPNPEEEADKPLD